MAVRWLSVAEAAKTLSISQSTVRRRIRRGMLESRTNAEDKLEVRIPVANTRRHASRRRDEQTIKPGPKKPQEADSVDVDDLKELGDLGELRQLDPPDDQATPASPTPPSNKFGPYSPLPSSQVGITRHQTNTTPFKRPIARLTPAELITNPDDDTDTSPQAEVTRYQRLAGASLILAQRQADEANEKIVLVRAQVNTWRRWCHRAWAGIAVVVLIAMFTVGVFGHRATRAQTALEAQREMTASVREEANRIDRQREALEQQVRDLQARLHASADDLRPSGRQRAAVSTRE